MSAIKGLDRHEMVLLAMRRIVCDAQRQPLQIGEALEVVLEANGAAPAASPAVEQHRQLFSAPILPDP